MLADMGPPDPWADRIGHSFPLRMMHHTVQDVEPFQSGEAGMGGKGGCIPSW
jgi:hypothetical protein